MQEVASWRGFCLTLLGVIAGATVFVWLFVALVDPFGTLPIDFPFDRWQVDGNARYAFPAFARSSRFDSANFGTSTSRLLRPEVLDREFGARFVNLAINNGSAYEQSRLMDVFIHTHRKPLIFAVDLDVPWCVTEGGMEKFSSWRFPDWLYEEGRWRDYRHLLDLYTVEKAGQAFAEFAGLKRRIYGRDGYTSFVPPESAYDAARARQHIYESTLMTPHGERPGAPEAWKFVALDMLRERLERLPPETLKLLYFAPYNHAVQPPVEDSGDVAWRECKRRVAALAAAIPNTIAVDFMMPSPITDDDLNYWDALHYREPIADRIVRDLARAARKEPSPDGDFVFLR